jgi:hypothetical protein
MIRLLTLIGLDLIRRLQDPEENLSVFKVLLLAKSKDI